MSSDLTYPPNCDVHGRGLQCPVYVCAVTRRRFPVGASPTRQPLQPEATGAVRELTKMVTLTPLTFHRPSCALHCERAHIPPPLKSMRDGTAIFAVANPGVKFEANPQARPSAYRLSRRQGCLEHRSHQPVRRPLASDWRQQFPKTRLSSAAVLWHRKPKCRDRREIRRHVSEPLRLVPPPKVSPILAVKFIFCAFRPGDIVPPVVGREIDTICLVIDRDD
jgi:hypothetical protein